VEKGVFRLGNVVASLESRCRDIRLSLEVADALDDAVAGTQDGKEEDGGASVESERRVAVAG